MRRALLAISFASLSALAVGCNQAPTASTDGGCEGVSHPIEGETHVPEGTTVDYTENPPSSGDHWACWAPWGVAKSVLPPERWVHNLEHGGIVLLFKCQTADGCPALSQPLIDIANAAPDAPTGGHRFLITADADIPQNIAAVAWGFSLLEDQPDQDDIDCFATAHEGQGPEDIPEGPDPTACPQSYQ